MIKYARMVFFGIPRIITLFPRVKKYAKNPDKYPIEERFEHTSKLLKALNKSSFHCRYVVEGLEDLPKGQCLFVGNHTSVYDPIAVAQIIDRPVGFLAKKEIDKMPFVSSVAKALSSTTIDRDDLRSEIKAFQGIEKILEKYENLSYVIFPEGTRSKKPDFDVLPFHSGSFKIATRRNIPVVPFVMYLSDRVLNQDYHYRVYPLQIKFLKPILPEEYQEMDTKEIAEIARSRIVQAKELLKSRDRELVMKFNNYSKKKTDKILLLPRPKD